MSRLIRSSSLGASSADLLGRFYNPVAARENNQPPPTAAAARPACATAKPLQNKPAVAAAAQENKHPPTRPGHAVIKPVQNIPAAAAVAVEKQRKSIFTFNSPPRREIITGREDFLDACALCQKRIKGKDRYMYGYLQVFCSPACREGQIAIDENSTLRCRQLAGKLIGSYSNANY